jgi:hypothetical protein
MVDSVSTFLVLLRAVLRLYNESVSAEKADAIDQLAKYVQFDPQPFRAVLQLKSQKVGPAAGEMAMLFGQYLSSIEHVLQSVDRQMHPTTHATNQATENSHG